MTLTSLSAFASDTIERSAGTVRIATFNASLSRNEPGALHAELEAGTSQQIRNVAETIRRVQPDILLINEFDHDPSGRAYDQFIDRFLIDPNLAPPPWPMDAIFTAPSNTGHQTGLDLAGDGGVGGPGDSQGFGYFEGQYGMALFSRFPLASSPARTFQKLLWRELPGAVLPDREPGSGKGDFYSTQGLDLLRLSSKSHWDVPITLPTGEALHVLASHPTPPVFDGPENRNGLRNADEIRFWSLYLSDGEASPALVDDLGQSGGLRSDALFVLLGDLNNDPEKGDGVRSAMNDLLRNSRLQDPYPSSASGGLDTADFSGNRLRVDYVLPSANLTIHASGVFWPQMDDPAFHLIGNTGDATSDHRLVWVDVAVTQ